MFQNKSIESEKATERIAFSIHLFIPAQSTPAAEKASDEAPLEKRARMGDESSLQQLETTPVPPVAEMQSLEMTNIPPQSVGPPSVAPQSVQPFSPPPQEPKSLEESFAHIDMKDLDDDKKRDACMMELISVSIED